MLNIHNKSLFIPIRLNYFENMPHLPNSSGMHSNNPLFFNDGILSIKEISDDEAPLLGLPLHVRVTLSTFMVLSILIGSYYKSIMYLYTAKTNQLNGWMHRPINVLIITSAITHHLTHCISGTWYILVLVIGSPLSDIFGSQSCQIMMYVAVYGLAYLSVGSLGIAIYRVMYIRHENLVKYIIGEKPLLLIILFMGGAFTGVIMILYMSENNGDLPGINMCTGLSASHTLVLIQYGNSIGQKSTNTEYGERAAILLCFLLQTIEFTIYIWFFYYRYRNDNGNIAKYLTQEDVRNRNLKNVSTFLGQFYGFVVEYSFLITLFLLHHIGEDYAQHFRALIAFTKFFDFGLLSAVEIYSSPGLRNYMKFGL